MRNGALLVDTIRTGAAVDQPGDLRGDRHDLLEVVEQQQGRPVTDQRDDTLARRPALSLLMVTGDPG